MTVNQRELLEIYIHRMRNPLSVRECSKAIEMVGVSVYGANELMRDKLAILKEVIDKFKMVLNCDFKTIKEDIGILIMSIAQKLVGTRKAPSFLKEFVLCDENPF